MGLNVVGFDQGPHPNHGDHFEGREQHAIDVQLPDRHRIACALVSPASAQLLNQKSLSAAMAMAMTIAQTALETCTKQGYNVSVHVIGRNGEVLVAVRGDGAPPHTIENSQRKA
jgi:Haem-degrading